MSSLTMFPQLKTRIIYSVIQRLYGFGSLGNKLRQQLYRFLFAEVGGAVEIQANAIFFGTNSIALGEKVNIAEGVRLNADEPGSSIKIGDGTKLDRGVDIWVVAGGCHIEIGEHTYLGPYVCMAGPGKIKIGRDCLIASHTSMYANNHIFADPNQCIAEQGLTHKGIVIEDDCWLGTGVRVLDGVTIGRGSVIGAGAVVTKDIPPCSVAVGVPAKVISQRG